MLMCRTFLHFPHDMIGRTNTNIKASLFGYMNFGPGQFSPNHQLLWLGNKIPSETALPSRGLPVENLLGVVELTVGFSAIMTHTACCLRQ